MEKWTDSEIFNIGSMPIQGPIVEAMLQKFMRNQNELIEAIKRIDNCIRTLAKIEIP